MLKDVQLLLLMIKHSHKNTCNVVRAEVDMFSELIDKFIPIFLQSKVNILIDQILLNRSRQFFWSLYLLAGIIR